MAAELVQDGLREGTEVTRAAVKEAILLTQRG